MQSINPKSICAVLLLFLAALACNLGSSSPTKTFKAFFEAQKKKDVPAIKKTLSKKSLEMLETAAKAKDKKLDEFIGEGFSSPGSKFDKMPETRDEKIDGDNATLEVKDEGMKNWDKMYFVKEDREWKIALDKTIEEMLKKIGSP
ncbi:MAG: DUF4878 domain-containing protein [Pyrinomonadaceae bacterium]